MTNRENVMAILNYENYDRMPLVHFGFWSATLEKWCAEGHLKKEEIVDCWDGTPAEKAVAGKLGFDFNWFTVFRPATRLFPSFETKVIEELPDGFRKVLNADGVIVLQREGAGSIPAEADHLLKGRKEWEEFFLPRLQFSGERIDDSSLKKIKSVETREDPAGIHCGSLFGVIRNWLGVTGISYLYVDDEKLFDEMIDTVGNLCYSVVQKVLESGVKFDFAHFWEDICFKNGPLVVPTVFYKKVGPYYRRITELVNKYGINIVSLDCDGMIDTLIPTWFDNGVNTMFPIEVGTWDASIAPWRKQYGKGIRGVGGMNKTRFSEDYSAIDAEIERLKPFIEMGGYVPCPDHRIPPDAKWENVQYYCEKMNSLFN